MEVTCRNSSKTLMLYQHFLVRLRSSSILLSKCESRPRESGREGLGLWMEYVCHVGCQLTSSAESMP